MRRRLTILLALITALAIGCATTTPSPYPAFDGDWLYDYAASVDENGMISPSDFGGAISKFERDGRNQRSRQLEALAHKIRAPEIIRIEIVGTRMQVDGGGGFKRNYELSGLATNPGVEIVWDHPTMLVGNLALDNVNDNIYFSDTNGTGIYRVDKAGQGLTQIHPSADVCGISVDPAGNTVYWADSSSRALWRHAV